MTQDVTVEPTAGEADNDVTVEEVKNVEAEQTDESIDESPKEAEAEEEQKPKTVEERLTAAEQRAEKLEREAESKQKKIDRQTAAYTEMQRALERERQEFQEKLATSKPTEATEPSIDDYDTHDEYINALVDYKAETRVKAKEAELFEKQQAAQQQKLAQERASIALEQEAEYLKVNPMYKASKAEFEAFAKTAQVNPAVESAIVSQTYKGNVPQLINYFGENNGENMDELIAISKMTPVEAAVEIYKVQQKLVAPKSKETKPLPKPVKAAPAAKSTKSLEKSSGSDVLAWVNS